jgi:hypothetical protein
VLRPDHRGHRVEIDAMIVGQRHCIHLGPGELPGDDVAVMLELREQHPVAGLQIVPSPALRDQVDPLGGAADEDDLLRHDGVDEARDAAARRLERHRHLGRALVDAAMHGRIGLGISAGDRVDHRLRLLRRGGAVEIGPALGDGREVGAPVERTGGGGHDVHDTHSPSPLGERAG